MRKIYLSILALGLAFQAGAQATTPFTCTNGVVYQVVGNAFYEYTIIPGQAVTGTWIANINNSGLTGTVAVNAMGYDTISNMLWALVCNGSRTYVVEIDVNGHASYLPVSNASGADDDFFDGVQSPYFNVGDVHDGYLYAAVGNGINGPTYYCVIDINKNRSTYLQLVDPTNLTQASNNTYAISTPDGPIQDWVYTQNNTLVSVSVQDSINHKYFVVTYSPTTGDVQSSIPITGDAANYTERGFGSMFYDASGNFYIMGNSTGNLYRVDITNGATTQVANIGANNNNDGASCPNSYVIPPNSLPITLQSFTVKANGNTASVQWTSAVESNNKGFYVERSADGQNWKDITFVATKAAGGNSSAPLNYQYTDQNPQQGYNYYRLKQVSLEGTATFSGVQSVVFSNIGTRIYPNPTNGVLHVNVSVSGTYRLVNAGGAIALKGSLQSGDNLLNVTGLSSGIYFMQIISGNNVKNTYEVEIK